MNNHATLSQAFDEYANYEITDEDLAIKIEENHSPFFHPFRAQDKLKILQYVNLIQFAPNELISNNLFNENAKITEGGNDSEDSNNNRVDENDTDNSNNNNTKKNVDIYDYIYIVKGTITATVEKESNLKIKTLGKIEKTEDIGRLRVNVEMQYGILNNINVYASTAGCVAIVLSYKEYIRFAENAQHVENSNRLGPAELSRRMQLLRKNPLTNTWDNRKLAKVSNALKEIKLEAFQTYQQENSFCKELFFVYRGEVQLKKEGNFQSSHSGTNVGGGGNQQYQPQTPKKKHQQQSSPQYSQQQQQQQQLNTRRSTTLAVLGPSHIGGVVEIVQLHETGAAVYRSTILAGVSGATILTLSSYMANILLFSNEREWNILYSLRRRRLLWDTMRMNQQSRHTDISLTLNNSHMMINFGYVLTDGVIAHLESGTAVKTVGMLQEKSNNNNNNNNNSMQKIQDTDYYLTVQHARERRRAGEALMRAGEFSMALSIFRIANEMFHASIPLLSKTNGIIKEETALNLKQGFERLGKMCLAFAALAAFAVRYKLTIEAITNCGLNFCRRSYNKATKEFIKAHEEWKIFLRLYGNSNELKQYVELNHHYKTMKPMANGLINEMAKMTRKAMHTEQRRGSDSSSKINNNNSALSRRGSSNPEAIDLDLIDNQMEGTMHVPSPPKANSGRNSSTNSPRHNHTKFSMIQKRSNSRSRKSSTKPNNGLVLKANNKIVVRSHPDAVHTDHHHMINPTYHNPYRYPLVDDDMKLSKYNNNDLVKISKRNASVQNILKKRSNKRDIRKSPNNNRDCVGHTSFPLTNSSNNMNNNYHESKMNENHNGETKIASPPVQPPMRQPIFKINVLLIEPNEKNARLFGYLLATQARRYGISCNFTHVRGGRKGLQLSGNTSEMYSYSATPATIGRDADASYMLKKITTKFTAIIVAVEVHDISWRSVVEKIRMNNSRTIIYTVANCSGEQEEETSFVKTTCKYGGNGFYKKPYNRGMASSVIMNIEKFHQQNKSKANHFIFKAIKDRDRSNM